MFILLGFVELLGRFYLKQNKTVLLLMRMQSQGLRKAAMVSGRVPGLIQLLVVPLTNCVSCFTAFIVAVVPFFLN